MPSRPSTIIRSPLSTSAMMPSTPETAGMPRLRARMAAWLVEPPTSVTIPAIGRSPRLIAWLGRSSCATRITDSSPLRESPAGIGMADRLARQVRADPQDHVADVGHPLPEIILLDPGELRRIALHDGLKRRQRGHLLVLDEVVDLGQRAPGR